MKKIKNFFKYFWSARIELNLLFILSILYIISVRFIINDYPEPFKGAYKLGWIFYTLALAYISSYIFYFVVVHLKTIKDKKAINEFIAPITYRLVGDGRCIFSELCKKVGVTNKAFPPDKKVVEEICTINPHSEAPMVTQALQRVNWLYYLKHYMFRSKGSISKIFERMPYLESDLIKLLSRIDDSVYFSEIEAITWTPIRNKDFSFLVNSLCNYFILTNDLEKYANKNLKEYLSKRRM